MPFMPKAELVLAYSGWAQLQDPMYNIKAVPDAIERAIYINCFELLSSILAGALSTFEVDLMGRIVKVKVSEVWWCNLKPMLVAPCFPRLKPKCAH